MFWASGGKGMTARIIAARAIQAYRDQLADGWGEKAAERHAADIAAHESRDFVQEIVLAVSECLEDGKSELFALAVVKERFAAPPPPPPPVPPFADTSTCSGCGEEYPTDELYDEFSDDGDAMFVVCEGCSTPEGMKRPRVEDR